MLQEEIQPNLGCLCPFGERPEKRKEVVEAGNKVNRKEQWAAADDCRQWEGVT
jgi:hypothetical protein